MKKNTCWFFGDSFTNGEEDTHVRGNFDESMSSFFKLTLNGKLPFIFCPDSTADDLEFAVCRMTSTPSISQVSNNLFSVSLNLTEVW